MPKELQAVVDALRSVIQNAQADPNYDDWAIPASVMDAARKAIKDFDSLEQNS